MRLRLKTPPSVEPVSLEEAKNYLKVETADDDTLISSLIKSARELIERYLRKALITQTWEMVLDDGGSMVVIPRPPLQSVTSIKTIAEDGTETVEDPEKYIVELGYDSPGRVMLKSGQTWSIHRGFASFIVEFIAGYGDQASDVPEIIRQAILQLTAYFYENRGVEKVIPFQVRNLINPYRVYWL